MQLFFKLALHFMCRKNTKRPSFASFVSVLGIMLGVASFFVIVTVLTSFEEQMKLMVRAANPNIVLYSTQGIPDVSGQQTKITEILNSHLKKQTPFIYQETVLAYKSKTASVYLRAIPGTQSANAENLNSFITPKDALKTIDIQSSVINSSRQVIEQNKNQENLYPHIILGEELAQVLHTKIGSVVKLMSFEPSDSGIPNIKYAKFYVTGLFKVGLSQFDKSFAYMNFNDGVKLFGNKNWASGIEIQLKDHSLSQYFADIIYDKLKYKTIAWQDIDSGLFKQIERDTASIKFIVFIISLVAAFNIIVTLSLTVIDRAKQIALLRAIGMRKKQVIQIFLLIGVVTGCLGSFLGVILSTVILKIFSLVHLGDLKEFYYVDTIPVHVKFSLMISVVTTAIILSFLGSIIPAYRAAKVAPIYGLKIS